LFGDVVLHIAKPVYKGDWGEGVKDDGSRYGREKNRIERSQSSSWVIF